MWKILLTALVAGASAIPTKVSYAVHEKRSTLTSARYSRSLRVEEDAVVPVRIALKQSNLDQGYGHLMEISHPSSGQYGKHWTAEDVASEFEPSSDSVDSVLQWLRGSGIEDARRTRNRDWIAFDASASQVESLFATKLHEYKDVQDGSIRVGCDEYSLPSHLAPHIDYITPGIQLSPPVSKSTVKRSLSKRSGWHGRHGWHHDPWNHPYGPYQPHWSNWTGPPSYPGSPDNTTTPGSGQIPADLVNCGKNITPPCIQALYGIPSAQANLDDGILGIYEFGDIYSQENLNQYFAAYAPYVPQGTGPNLVSINGATAPVAANSSSNTGESDVDFDLAYALLGDVPITLYQIDNLHLSSLTGSYLMDPFFAAVDAAYCDDSEKSDNFDCGTVSNLASVVSISYGIPENYDSFKAQDRACQEFMKLSLQGHTFVVASGDYGVAANPAADPSVSDVCSWDGCLARSTSDNLTNSETIFNPNFPASCPYVLAVGATQLNDDDTIDDPESVMQPPGIGTQQSAGCDVINSFFSSGGGFSNYWSQPSYQSDAVAEYFANHDPGYASYSFPGGEFSTLPSSGIYNRAGRAFPDVSANGAKLAIFVQDRALKEYGTSLAAPIWASILAQINQARKDAGKGAVGFVNTVLYQNPDIFSDITNGSNPGCGTEGFAAVEGWDPVTGLGTPNFEALQSLFLSLP